MTAVLFPQHFSTSFPVTPCLCENVVDDRSPRHDEILRGTGPDGARLRPLCATARQEFEPAMTATTAAAALFVRNAGCDFVA